MLLVKEGVEMIDKAEAKGPLDAARALVSRAKGQGSIESKAKRIASQIKDARKQRDTGQSRDSGQD